MDYQEAINTLKDEIKCSCYRNRGYCGICTIYSEMDRNNIIDACKTAIYAMQELHEYHKLGTLEEVREAVEKQRAKKPNNVETEGYRYTDTYRCPTCGGNFSGTGIADYCYHCGQRLNWE